MKSSQTFRSLTLLEAAKLGLALCDEHKWPGFSVEVTHGGMPSMPVPVTTLREFYKGPLTDRVLQDVVNHHLFGCMAPDVARSGTITRWSDPHQESLALSAAESRCDLPPDRGPAWPDPLVRREERRTRPH